MISSLSNSPLPPARDSPFKQKISQHSKSGSTWAVTDCETPRSLSRSPSPLPMRRSSESNLISRSRPVQRSYRNCRSRSHSKSRSYDSADDFLNGIPVIAESHHGDDVDSFHGDDYDEISFRYSPNPSMKSMKSFGSDHSMKSNQSLSEQNLSAKQEQASSLYLPYSRDEDEFSELTFDFSYATGSITRKGRSSSPKPPPRVTHRSSRGRTASLPTTNVHTDRDCDADSLASSNNSAHGLVTQFNEVMEVLEGIAENDALSSSQNTLFLKNCYPDHVSDVDYKKYKDIPLTLSMMEKKSANYCLKKDEAQELKEMSIKNPKILIGWQIQLLKPDGGAIGVGVITDMQKDLLSRKTLYRVSILEQGDYWVKLQRTTEKKGVNFKPLRQVFKKYNQSLVEIQPR